MNYRHQNNMKMKHKLSPSKQNVAEARVINIRTNCIQACIIAICANAHPNINDCNMCNFRWINFTTLERTGL